MSALPMIGLLIAFVLPVALQRKGKAMTIAALGRRIGILALSASMLAAAPTAAQGQAYPNQTVKIVVPFTPGGGVDGVARVLVSRLAEELGQSVVIENKGGAGGMLGASAVVQSPPDGYTLLFGTGSTHGTNASIYTKLSYDPVRDFAPIVLVSTSPLLLVATPTFPAKSVRELIDVVRARPGEFSFGSYGTGSINHLSAELFNQMAGIQANHIPYRGAAPALTDLIAGRIHYTLDGVTTSLPHVQSGTTRLLGVTSPTRWPALPDHPTIAEAGVPGFDTMVWFGLFAPAATPKPIIELLNAKVNASLAMPGVRQSYDKLGVQVVGGSPEVLAQKVESEMKKWAGIVREKNIRIDP
jgi:tripartite-type tricarboxylate transporter receptor subunit TctC